MYTEAEWCLCGAARGAGGASRPGTLPESEAALLMHLFRERLLARLLERHAPAWGGLSKRITLSPYVNHAVLESVRGVQLHELRRHVFGRGSRAAS